VVQWNIERGLEYDAVRSAFTEPAGFAKHIDSTAYRRGSEKRKLILQPVALMNRTFILSQNYSAVTAACMVLRKTLFDDVGGFDENLPNNFNDVDFCLRLRERGWQIIWTPYADLIHQESASRGRHSDSEERARLLHDMAYLQEKWGEQLRNDPFY